MAKGWSFDSLVKALKGGAFLDVGKTKGTIAAGDDSRIVNALDKNKNLSDVPNKYRSIRNIGGFPIRGDLLNTKLDDLGHTGANGLWYQPSPKDKNLGYPKDGTAGSLLIQQAGNSSTTHMFTEWHTGRTWVRTYTGSAWTPWREHLTNTGNLSELSNPDQALKNLSGFPFRGGLYGKNLNGIKGTQYGIWYQNREVEATTERGYPVSQAGVMELYQNNANGPDGCTAIYYPFESNEIYKRNYFASSSSWSPWVRYLMSSGNLSEVEDKEQARRNLEIYRAIYPVGIVVTFDSNTNPNTTFYGTTWTEIKDGRAVRSSPDGALSNIGSDSFTLSEANIPKHTHTISGTISAGGAHTHKGGWNGPGEVVRDNEWRDTSGTDNQGRHDRRRTSSAGSHSHTFSGSVSTAYNSPTSPVTHYGASKYYRMWKRTS